MAEHTAIEWADSTVNAEMGCDGCELWDPKRGIRICYAGTQTERMLRRGPRRGWPPAFDRPTIFPGRIERAASWKDLSGTKRKDKPWLDGLPRIIFLNDMGDSFTAGLPLDWLAPSLPIIARSPHLWLLLTKRADRQLTFVERHPLSENVWTGVSITSPQDPRLRYLLRTRAAVRWVSYEPVLADVDFAKWMLCDSCGDSWHGCRKARWNGKIACCPECRHNRGGINWLVIGGASAQRLDDRPMPTDITALRHAVQDAAEAGVPVFVKQLGSRPYDGHWFRRFYGHPASTASDFDAAGWRIRDPKGGDWSEWPEDFRVRDFPSTIGATERTR